MKRKSLISLEEALSLNEDEVKTLFSNYLNPGMAKAFELLGFDKVYIKASGTVLRDRKGNKYLDFLGGFGSLNLGHNPKKVIEALQLVEDRPNILQTSLNPVAAALAHNLAVITPGELSRTFFCNSGTEAVEGAIKLSRAATGKKKIIYCRNSFHGKTMGSLSVTGREKYQKKFTPLIPHCISIPFGDADALERELKQHKDVAAFIVEPIQGEGGIIVPPEGYLKQVRELCTQYEVLLIIDEVQTGFGRTGKMFACEHEGVVPDILCLAKSLGGGIMPVGAFITKPDIWDRAYGGLQNFSLHTSTFGGCTRSVAAALAAIEEIIKMDLPKQAAEKGSYFIAKLREITDKHPLVKEVRGKGLLIGIEFKDSGNILDKLASGVAKKISQDYFGAFVAGELLNRYRIITAYSLNNYNTIRLEPPLIVTYEHLDYVLNAVDEILKNNRSTGKIIFTGVKNAVESFFRSKMKNGKKNNK
ncbi:MAG: Aminotransferase class-III [Clostridia bacterium 41_269]|nr:MAG: Aminotransferase class-III [Clostridia bacterium 41_269]